MQIPSAFCMLLRRDVQETNCFLEVIFHRDIGIRSLGLQLFFTALYITEVAFTMNMSFYI